MLREEAKDIYTQFEKQGEEEYNQLVNEVNDKIKILIQKEKEAPKKAQGEQITQ